MHGKNFLTAGCIFIFAAVNLHAQESLLRVNLLGYPKSGPKRALLLAKKPSKDNLWLVSEDGSNKTRLSLRLSEKKPWPPFTHYYEIDFTSIQAEGKYRIANESGGLQSPYFSIGRYAAVQEDVISFMQTQRCGFNPFINKVCHPFDGRSFYGNLPDSSYVDVRGGWHDAGDQLKYLITGSNATARMMMAWERYPKAWGDKVNAWGQPGPNGIPDVLDEARWGLDWIHRLHPSPDQLVHQVADDRDHRGFKMPDNDSSNYGWGPNSYRAAYFATGKPQGTGKYMSEATGLANLAGRSAAAMAMGYRIWKESLHDDVFAAQCLRDAMTLYALGKSREGFQQGNSYGAPYRYNERTWADDMEWAAAELYTVTGRKEYLMDAIRYADIVQTESWMERDSVAHYEMYPYVNVGHFALWQAGDSSVKNKVAAFYRHNLERIRERAERNDYGVGHLFVWCSNNYAAAVSTQALLYEKMTGDRRYRSLLQDHVNWLMGLNPWGTSMITGIPEGGDYPVDVHMPFWRLQKKLIRGSLVDGPLASSIHEGMLQIMLSEPDEYAHLQPGHVTYWDDWADYSTNEPTMDGSADLCLLFAFLHQED